MVTIKNNSVSYLCLLVLVFFASVLFYLSTNTVQKTDKCRFYARTTQSVIHKNELEKIELDGVLSKAAMPNGTVILTTLNEAWANPGSMIDLFLESFKIGEGTSKLVNHLVILAMDPQAFDRCKSIHPHCYFVTTPGVNFTAEKRFMTPDYLKLVWRKIEVLRIVLELGYNFLFTDGDIMWFRDPFPYLDDLDEIQIACDSYNGNPRDIGNYPNTGFKYVKSNNATIEFYKYWYMSSVYHSDIHDQEVFDVIRHDSIVAALGLRVKYLDTKYFGGFCHPSRDMNKVCTMHANCCIGIENKIHDLKLILSDWKNYTLLSPVEKANISSSWTSPWRAPNKCKV
ncbi:hypothetical protein ACHQM5_008232 [Ranunculus cassubicifolius]